MKRLSTLICFSIMIPVTVPLTAESRRMEEVIVTATKREESVQDVPIAISAFLGEDLENRGVQDLYGLQEVSPSISVYSSNSESNGGTIRIRGVGTTGNNPGLEAAVGTFIDGVYRSRAGLAFNDLVDIERIEILRGPQGTLFGKNTSAGALHVITKKPEFEPSYSASFSAGDFSLLKATASATGPITDQVAYRAAITYQERDGYYEDDISSDDYNGRDRYSLKGQLLWAPTDTFESRLIVDYTDKNEDCCPARFEFSNTTQNTVSGTSRRVLNNGQPSGFILNDLLQRVGRPEINANFPDEELEVGLNFRPFEEVQDWGIQNEATWQITENLSLVAISSYREFEVFRGQDIDFSGADLLRPQFTDENFENFSQEFQFTYTTENVDYLFGAYFYTEEIETNEGIRLASQGAEFLSRLIGGTESLSSVDGALAAVGGSDFVAQLPGVQLLIPTKGFDDGNGSSLGSFDLATGTYIDSGAAGDVLRPNYVEGDGYDGAYTQDTDGWSVFTHNVWHINDKWSLTLGARYSNETKEATTTINGSTPVDVSDTDAILVSLLNNSNNEAHCTARVESGSLCNNASWKDEETEKEWTGTIKLAFAITDDINIYTSFSRGYKAGGFNLDQQSVEFDSFGSFLATGGVPNFLGTLNPGDDPNTTSPVVPQFVIDDPRTEADGSNGFDELATGMASGCGARGGITAPGLGLNEIACASIDDDHRFDPELVDAFELGIKAQLLDGRLTANIALFYSDFEDFQLNTFTGNGFLVNNVAEVISEGIEIETTWFLGDSIVWTFGVTYADAKYGDDLNKKNTSEAGLFLDQDFATLEDWAALENIEGRQLTHAPRWQGSTSLFMEKEVVGMMAYGNLNVGYRGRHNTGSDLDPEKEIAGEAIVNLQVGMRALDDRWDVKLWARNLTDRHVKTIIFDSVFQQGSFSTLFAPPRMVGVTVTTHL
ncbi:MAG: TonB-dependent receptor [Pseudomonadales bacterium]|nr:TonB-dependent receptor [Pseudomonadales bacterium]